MFVKNKGSVLVTVLIIFSMVSIIGITCIGVSQRSYEFVELEVHNIKLKQDVENGLEIAYGNTLDVVKQAIQDTKDKQTFIDYFLGNKMDIFKYIESLRIKELSNIDIKIIDISATSEQDIIIKLDISAKHEKFTKMLYSELIINNLWKTNKTSNINEKDLLRIKTFKEI